MLDTFSTKYFDLDKILSFFVKNLTHSKWL